MQTGENSIVEARILYHSNTYTYIHSALICSKIQVYDVMVNITINSSALSGVPI